MHYFIKSVGIALQNIKANPLHTFLSTLGIIIGVASLVGILALGDGLEAAARSQISKTTSVENLTITSKNKTTVNGVSIEVKNRPKITYQQARELQQKYAETGVIEYVNTRTTEVIAGDSLFGIYLHGSMENGLAFLQPEQDITGRYFTYQDIHDESNIVVINKNFANRLEFLANPLGSTLLVNGTDFTVVGVIDFDAESPRAVIPITVFDADDSHFPVVTMNVKQVEQIPMLKEEIAAWLDKEFEQGSAGFSILSDDYWVDQLKEGILLFKLIMGAITGISVLVGGIGVMNVLLISVTERTKEIGIRKATGAKKKDIILQFMAESITISLVGSVAGWLIGMVGLFAFIPIVNRIVSIGFSMVINPASILIILVLAIFIGLFFGTYPAWRASQLDPIDAIRHE